MFPMASLKFLADIPHYMFNQTVFNHDVQERNSLLPPHNLPQPRLGLRPPRHLLSRTESDFLDFLHDMRAYDTGRLLLSICNRRLRSNLRRMTSLRIEAEQKNTHENATTHAARQRVSHGRDLEALSAFFPERTGDKPKKKSAPLSNVVNVIAHGLDIPEEGWRESLLEVPAMAGTEAPTVPDEPGVSHIIAAGAIRLELPPPVTSPNDLPDTCTGPVRRRTSSWTGASYSTRPLA
ncbi:hypothetical protein CONLIGDRAFT_472764 [Coniochaeta ligniaria NRRL 30616]|uniref:Uncharacterized protein n=1 Tax=Coniochaeta ligniaria NRRL 30616 TaxID=1408157 RepID=A0A1J7JB51_9PEZI|nr:hypothetical protein CONLIGDRAFT_472764 [Coniochaeta ligniaria NRRL 30616]